MTRFKMKKTISRLALTSLVCLIAILAFPVLAFAQAVGEVAKPTALDNLSAEIMNVLVPVFVAFIGAFATWLLAKVTKKFHIEVGDKTTAAWAELARTAALRGAEWARKKTKALAEGKKLPGGEIMEVSANWAIEMAKSRGLPALAREKLESLIEAHLFQLRQEEAAISGSVDRPKV